MRTNLLCTRALTLYANFVRIEMAVTVRLSHTTTRSLQATQKATEAT